jgi:hypothetical protein
MRNLPSIQPYASCVLLAAASVALPNLAACGGDDTDVGSTRGTLVVKVQLGNNRTCDALGVKTIRAELNEKLYVESAPCDDYQVRFRDIPAGTYKVALFGVDDDGVEVMDSVNTPNVLVNVAGDDKTVVGDKTVTLTAAPAHLLVRWGFGFGTCRGVGIDRLEIALWDASGNDQVLGKALDCDLEGEGKDQYRTIDDPMRRFHGDEAGEISVQPVDKNGVDVGQPASFKFKAPGPGHEVKVTVHCEENACTGSGKPD